MVVWRKPAWEEARRWSEDKRFEPYAEWCEWVAEVETKKGREQWLALSRTWHGYPDPPEFAFFAMNAEGAGDLRGRFRLVAARVEQGGER